MIIVEFLCPTHDRFEALLSRPAPDATPCPECGVSSPWTPSAPRFHIPVGVVVTGGSQERPPNALDTRAIADGMPATEWHKRERKKDRDATWSKIKREM